MNITVSKKKTPDLSCNSVEGENQNTNSHEGEPIDMHSTEPATETVQPPKEPTMGDILNCAEILGIQPSELLRAIEPVLLAHRQNPSLAMGVSK